MEMSKILGVALVGVAGAAVGYNLTKEGRNNTRMAIGKMADKFGMKKRSDSTSESADEKTIKETINNLNDRIYTLYKNQELSEEQRNNLQKSILNLMIDGEESLEKFKSNIESQIKYELNKNDGNNKC